MNNGKQRKTLSLKDISKDKSPTQTHTPIDRTQEFIDVAKSKTYSSKTARAFAIKGAKTRGKRGYAMASMAIKTGQSTKSIPLNEGFTKGGQADARVNGHARRSKSFGLVTRTIGGAHKGMIESENPTWIRDKFQTLTQLEIEAKDFALKRNIKEKKTKIANPNAMLSNGFKEFLENNKTFCEDYNDISLIAQVSIHKLSMFEFEQFGEQRITRLKKYQEDRVILYKEFLKKQS